MNSLMFTFSAEQISTELGATSKVHESPSRLPRKRPSSSNPFQSSKSKKLSSNMNQLFENSNIQSCAMEQSPQKSLGLLKTRNSSIQMQQKKKLRNIIDNMLGKNFDSSSINKVDSVIITNRKNINKHRSYLNNTKHMDEIQQIHNHKQSKQNEFNFQNMNVKSTCLVDSEQDNQKHRPNIKIKKFQFAHIKINQMNQNNQRYSNPSSQEDVNKNDRQSINISRQSIDRENLGRKILRSKTPKIMYPDSDSKLPSVFRTNSAKSTSGNSMRKRTTRIFSAHFISEFQEKKTDQTVSLQNKNAIENVRGMDPLIRTNFKPQSMMLQSRKLSMLINKDEQKKDHIFPKRLIFDNNQDISEGISRKLGQRNIENKNQSLRVSTRAKSTHGNYAHRKLKQINNIISQPLNIKERNKEKSVCNKNLSHQSRQTAQESILQSSTEYTLINISGKTSKTLEQRQPGCSITFHIQKE